ncbi:hypothetical protein C9I56_35755 [Paraburkholderia caribensis]|nr:hypothetical protein C9I56_35755 [Paraburkholderia caribensis]
MNAVRTPGDTSVKKHSARWPLQCHDMRLIRMVDCAIGSMSVARRHDLAYDELAVFDPEFGQ